MCGESTKAQQHDLPVSAEGNSEDDENDEHGMFSCSSRQGSGNSGDALEAESCEAVETIPIKDPCASEIKISYYTYKDKNVSADGGGEGKQHVARDCSAADSEGEDTRRRQKVKRDVEDMGGSVRSDMLSSEKDKTEKVFLCNSCALKGIPLIVFLIWRPGISVS